MYYSIAIDGPSGAGKSSLAKNLAKATGFHYVDTGAMYRTVGLYVKRRGVDSTDSAGIAALLPGIDIGIVFRDGTQYMFLNGDDVTGLIREPEISLYASDVSRVPQVREFLFDLQRDFARNNNVIMDGRDIGTVILPNADVKIFLHASPEDRARRRYEELVSRGVATTFDEVLEAMVKRDENDSKREIAPTKPAPDAILLDNSGYEIERTYTTALEIIKKKIPCCQEKNVGLR